MNRKFTDGRIVMNKIQRFKEQGMGRQFPIENSNLTYKDLENIFDLAHKEYLSRNPSIFKKIEHFNILCIVEAYNTFLKNRKQEKGE